jgi:hypothetical protein
LRLPSKAADARGADRAARLRRERGRIPDVVDEEFAR